ncbi:MAG: hypothetical protein RIC29_02535 [Rhodospirillaceae bacterium]
MVRGGRDCILQYDPMALNIGRPMTDLSIVASMPQAPSSTVPHGYSSDTSNYDLILATMLGSGTSGSTIASPIAGQTSTLAENQLGILLVAQSDYRSATEIAAMTPHQIKGLAPEELAAFTPSQLAALMPSQISALTTSQIQAFQPSQVAAFTPAQLNGLTVTQIATLTSDQFAVLSPTQISKLTTTQVKGLTSEQISVLSEVQFSSFTTANYRQ